MTQLGQVLSAVFWGALVLNVLVLFHEGGHYLAARAFGMRVTEFFVGMPCRARISHRSRTRGTEFGITPVLVGGYTRICGMEGEPGPHAAHLLAAVARRGSATVSELAEEAGCGEDEVLDELTMLADWASVEPVWASGDRPTKRELPCGFRTVRRDAHLLTTFDAGHDFADDGTTEAGQPHDVPGGLDSFLAVERGRTYLGKGLVPRLAALFAGPVVNIVLGLALVAGTLSLSGITTARDVPVIGSVSAGSLAAVSGIEAEDEISTVDGTPVTTWVGMGQELRRAIANGSPFECTLERDGSNLTVTVDPSRSSDGSGLFGVVASTETYHPGAVESLGLACRYVGMTASYVLQLLQPSHVQEVVTQSSSVVGISVAASEAAAQGLADLLFLMAAISLSLGFMNLLPVPPLDGGKIAIELIQAVIRRPLSIRAQSAVSYLGLAAMLVLFFFVLQQDVVRIVTGG